MRTFTHIQLDQQTVEDIEALPLTAKTVTGKIRELSTALTVLNSKVQIYRLALKLVQNPANGRIPEAVLKTIAQLDPADPADLEDLED